MKTATELVKEWKKRIEKPEQIVALMPDQARAAFRVAMMRCTDELEALVREADKVMVEFSEYDDYVDNEWIRRDLLGTTQSSGGSREGEK